MSRLIGKLARWAQRLAKSPTAAFKDVPDDIESFRMRLWRDSIFRRRQDLVYASNCPSKMLDKVIEMWQPRSILDVGCGTGKAIDYFISRGLSDVVGVEGSQIAIDSATNPEVLKCCDLVNTVDLGRTFDLVYSFEVAEHLPPHAANAFIGTLVNHGDRVLMTAARPGQGGMGHLNEQEPIYWIEKLDHVGFDYDERAAEELKGVRDLHYSNIMVFVRRTTPELN